MVAPAGPGGDVWGRDLAGPGHFWCSCSLCAPAVMLHVGHGTEMGCHAAARSQLQQQPWVQRVFPAAGRPGECPGSDRGCSGSVFHSWLFQLIAACEAKRVLDILSASALLLESKDKCGLPMGVKPGENLRPTRCVLRSGQSASIWVAFSI